MTLGRGMAKPKQRYPGLPERIEACLECSEKVCCMRSNPFGTLLATGCEDGSVRLWDCETRSIAVEWYQGHGMLGSDQVEQPVAPVTCLAWSRDGHQILSGGEDGRVVLWNVMEGKVEFVYEFPLCGKIVNISCRENVSKFDGWGVDFLISFEKPVGPRMLTISGRGVVEHWIGVDNRRSRVVASEAYNAIMSRLDVPGMDDGVKLKGIQWGPKALQDGSMAIFAPNGIFYVVAARGLLTLFDAHSGKVMDAVVLQKYSRVKWMEFSNDGKYLLLSCEDAYVPIYHIDCSVKNDRMDDFIHVEEFVESFKKQKTFNNKTSVMRKSNPFITLVRRFVSASENWNQSIFSSDGNHVFTSLESKQQEQVIYTWNFKTGKVKNILEGAGSSVEAMISLPTTDPQQLFVLTKNGVIHVWSRVLTQGWSAFAPEFETLEQNREYVESETEFDDAQERLQTRNLHKVEIDDSEALDVGMWAGCDEVEPHLLFAAAETAKEKRAVQVSTSHVPLVHLPVDLMQCDSTKSRTSSEKEELNIDD